ncbi:ABC transporter ATP-binding protein [Rhizobium ruizarguesonis]
MGALTLSNVKRSYGHVEVLKGIDLDVPAGAFLVLLGPSGCGKSTLLSLIAGLDRTTDGDISIGGRVVNDVAPKDRDIAMVFQSYALYPSMSARDNIGFGLRMRGVSQEERNRATAAAAETLRIGHLLDRKPAHLSGGQRQRVAMARALVRQPKVFLFDEPLSNLDAQLRTEMRAEIKKLHEKLGTTIVYVTHDQIEAMTMATKIAIMQDGNVMQYGSPDEIYRAPANLFVAKFVGSPTINLIKASIEFAGEGATLRLMESDDRSGIMQMERRLLAEGVRAGQEILIGIRPESARLSDGSVSPGKGTIEVDGFVSATENTGSDLITTITFGGGTIVARLRPGQAQTNAPIRIAFNTEDALIFDASTERRLNIVKEYVG